MSASTALASVIGHLAIALLLWGIGQARSGGPVPSAAMQARFVVIDLPAQSEESAAQQANPQEERPVEASRSTDVPAAGKPASRPTPTPTPEAQPPRAEPEVGAEARSAARGSDAAASEATASEEASPVDTGMQALLRGVRGNWLEPPGARRLFLCRVTVAFAQGRVTGVEVEEACGDAQIRESIVRAAWKSASLLGQHAQEQPLSFEFSP